MTIRQVAATLALDNGHKYQMELDPSQKLLVDTRSSGRSDFDVGFQL